MDYSDILRQARLFGCVCLLAGGFGATLIAQPAAPAEPAGIQIGFEQRVRTEDWNNLFDFSDQLNDEREQIRYRTRVWANVPLPKSVSFSVGLNQETTQKFGQVNHFDEIMFETMYLDFKRVFVKGLSFRVGRQNLMRGEGFILMEGSPGDGSRTIYYNAAVLAYSFKKSKIEAMGILNPARDRFLPIIHDQKKLLQNWDDQALGLYYTDRNRAATSIDAYYFYKKEVHDRTSPASAAFQPNRQLSTLGGRVVQTLSPSLTAVGEFAWQWGAQHPSRDITAHAGYGYLKKTFNARFRPYAQAGYWTMSGDDPKTREIEGWDPLFERWPKWSELYIYSQLKEYAISYWTNTSMWQAEAGVSPSKKSSLRLTYYNMAASHSWPGDQRIFAQGTDRGHMVQARLDYIFNPSWKGHALYEGVLPGDFYNARDKAYFVRFEMSYLIQREVLKEQWSRLTHR